MSQSLKEWWKISSMPRMLKAIFISIFHEGLAPVKRRTAVFYATVCVSGDPLEHKALASAPVFLTTPDR
jgi:hypothetical protein